MGVTTIAIAMRIVLILCIYPRQNSSENLVFLFGHYVYQQKDAHIFLFDFQVATYLISFSPLNWSPQSQKHLM
jgi:hypothetical protein